MLVYYSFQFKSGEEHQKKQRSARERNSSCKQLAKSARTSGREQIGKNKRARLLLQKAAHYLCRHRNAMKSGRGDSKLAMSREIALD
jgi:hypothetical protein